jgi:IS4 transposase
VAIGACTTGETTLARDLLGSLGGDMLVLADRNFYSFDLWTEAAAAGAQLLWRTKAGHVLRPREQLPDGSWLARLRRFSNYHMRGTDVEVRVIDYGLDDPGRPHAEGRYRLITTITDPQAAPAADLAALYPQRWEFETALAELKTHQRGPRMVLRSKQPELARQEIYGYLCVHYAIRWLMHAVALEADADPDRLSFTRTLRAARRTAGSHPGFSPSHAG